MKFDDDRASREEILRWNHEMQDYTQGDIGWGRPVLNIPEDDYYFLIKINPDLNSKDPIECRNAWRKFMQSPEAAAYRQR